MKTTTSPRRAGFAVVGALTLLGCASLAPGARAQGAGGNGLVTVNIQGAPVQTVLRSLFHSAGKNFTIDNNVTGTVTLDVTQVPFDTALSAILSSANPPLAAPLENNIYHVQVAKVDTTTNTPTTTTTTNNPNGGNNIQTAVANDPQHAYRIPVAHFDAAYMSYLIAAFSRKGGPPIVVPADPTGQQLRPLGGQQGGNSGFGNQGGFRRF